MDFVCLDGISHRLNFLNDELINFGQSSWHNSILEYAVYYSQKVNQDFQEFRQSI